MVADVMALNLVRRGALFAAVTFATCLTPTESQACCCLFSWLHGGWGYGSNYYSAPAGYYGGGNPCGCGYPGYSGYYGGGCSSCCGSPCGMGGCGTGGCGVGGCASGNCATSAPVTSPTTPTPDRNFNRGNSRPPSTFQNEDRGRDNLDDSNPDNMRPPVRRQNGRPPLEGTDAGTTIRRRPDLGNDAVQEEEKEDPPANNPAGLRIRPPVTPPGNLDAKQTTRAVVVFERTARRVRFSTPQLARTDVQLEIPDSPAPEIAQPRPATNRLVSK